MIAEPMYAAHNPETCTDCNPLLFIVLTPTGKRIILTAEEFSMLGVATLRLSAELDKGVFSHIFAGDILAAGKAAKFALTTSRLNDLFANENIGDEAIERVKKWTDATE